MSLAAPILSVSDVLRYAQALDFHDPKLLVAIATIESDLQPSVVSSGKGDHHYGLMQIGFRTAKGVGFRGKAQELYNWKTNMKYASKYLSVLLYEYNYHRASAVAAYNAGKVYICKSKCPKGEYVNQDYVDKVLKKYAELQKNT